MRGRAKRRERERHAGKNRIGHQTAKYMSGYFGNVQLTDKIRPKGELPTVKDGVIPRTFQESRDF
ncbi:hypothetical protein SDC9_35335 [bioreactor metagenome]|uniref:Uncharacterized protein n=1 Tax=bioreactor metagenome TaxID=1076179 RepID=A0A644VDF7_9ZZZZ